MSPRFSIILAAAPILALAGYSYGYPTAGSSCGGCHGASTGRQTVSGNQSTLDLGLGAKKTFEVLQGGVVKLTDTVNNGASSYAVQLKGFEGGGLVNSAADHLIFTPDPAWKTSGSPTYYLSSLSGTGWASTPTIWDFNLAVSASTPVDTYQLEFTTAGKGGGTWSQSEIIYVKVNAVPEPVGIGAIGFAGLSLLARRRKH